MLSPNAFFTYKKYLSDQKWFAIAAATVCLSVLMSLLSPTFASLTNMQSIFVQASVTAIMAVGMTYIIIIAGIDISVGAILFFVTSLFAELIVATGSYALAFSAAIICGCVLGALNGFLTVFFKVTPLITTLATYTIYRGMAIHLTGAENIPVPRKMDYLGSGELLGIPVPIILLFIVSALGVYGLSNTRFGLYVKAIGNSEQSALESKLPITPIRILVYMIGGACASIAGLILIARIGGLQSGIGIGLEFTVIAAVILGGTKLSGGSGSVVGSVLGAVFLVLIDNALNMLNASPYIYDTVRGAILLMAVGVDRFSSLRQEKRLQLLNAQRIQKSA